MGAKAKVEIRNSKYETRNNYEGQSMKPLEIPKREIRNRAPAGSRRFRTFGLQPFALVSDFVFRISCFPQRGYRHRPPAACAPGSATADAGARSAERRTLGH